MVKCALRRKGEATSTILHSADPPAQASVPQTTFKACPCCRERSLGEYRRGQGWCANCGVYVRLADIPKGKAKSSPPMRGSNFLAKEREVLYETKDHHYAARERNPIVHSTKSQDIRSQFQSQLDNWLANR